MASGCRAWRTRRRAGRGASRRGRRRGFSLIELLAVVLILGLTFVIAAVEGSKAIRRQRLAGAAQDVVTFMSRASAEMQTRDVPVFVLLNPAARTLQLVADTNQNNTPDSSPTDRVIQTLTLPDDVVFSTANPAQVQTALWSDDSTSTSNTRWLGCDFRMRTFNTTAAGQITGIATLNLTHLQMSGSSASLTPKAMYQIRVNPVWNVSSTRSLF